MGTPGITSAAPLGSRLRQRIDWTMSPRNLPDSTIIGNVMFTSSQGIFSLANV